MSAELLVGNRRMCRLLSQDVIKIPRIDTKKSLDGTAANMREATLWENTHSLLLMPTRHAMKGTFNVQERGVELPGQKFYQSRHRFMHTEDAQVVGEAIHSRLSQILSREEYNMLAHTFGPLNNFVFDPKDGRIKICDYEDEVLPDILEKHEDDLKYAFADACVEIRKLVK